MKGQFPRNALQTSNADDGEDINSIFVGAQNPITISSLTLFSGDVGGQKTLRSYWRNYFEKTDALIWVVDATDRLRLEDCRAELHALLQEEVQIPIEIHDFHG